MQGSVTEVEDDPVPAPVEVEDAPMYWLEEIPPPTLIRAPPGFEKLKFKLEVEIANFSPRCHDPVTRSHVRVHIKPTMKICRLVCCILANHDSVCHPIMPE